MVKYAGSRAPPQTLPHAARKSSLRELYIVLNGLLMTGPCLQVVVLTQSNITVNQF